MDSRQAVCDMTTTLLGRLPPEYRSADIVCDYSTALSESRRHDIMARFIAGDCRILICTEAAGMGIDVADVVRVIQWTIPRQLNLASFWQRAGRAGHNRQLQSIAILFYKKAQCIPSGGEHPLKLFCLPPDSPDASRVVKAIRAYDAGTQHSKRRTTEAEPLLLPADETGSHRNTLVSNTLSGSSTHDENIQDSEFQEEDGPENMQLHPNQNSRVGQTMRMADPPLADPNERFGVDTHLSNSSSTVHGTNGGGLSLRTMDRGLLWFLSTTGCQREVIRKYFDDTDLLPFPPLSQAQHTNQSGSGFIESFSFPCCDNCLKLNQDTLPSWICALLPPDPNSPVANRRQFPVSTSTEANAEDQDSQSPGLRTSKPLSRGHRSLLKKKLEEFRESVWMREGLNKSSGVIVPAFFLQNQHIALLVSQAGSINSIDTLAKVLARQKVDLQFSAIGPYAQELLEVLVSTIAIELPNPRPIPQPTRGRQAVPMPDSANANGNLISQQVYAQVRNTGGRPTRAMRAEEIRLESEIATEAQIRFANAEAAGLDSSRWNLSLLGRRRRGRPSFLEQEAREQAQAGKKEISDSLLNAQDYPLLWGRMQARESLLPG